MGHNRAKKKSQACETLDRTLLREAKLMGLTSVDKVEKMAKIEKNMASYKVNPM